MVLFQVLCVSTLFIRAHQVKDDNGWFPWPHQRGIRHEYCTGVSIFGTRKSECYLLVFIWGLEKAMAPHSSTLAWKTPWTEEPGRRQSMGSHRVGHDWFHLHALEKEMATHSSVLAWRIPGTGKPGGLLSMGSHRVRHDWSDLAAAYGACISYL